MAKKLKGGPGGRSLTTMGQQGYQKHATRDIRPCSDSWDCQVWASYIGSMPGCDDGWYGCMCNPLCAGCSCETNTDECCGVMCCSCDAGGDCNTGGSGGGGEGPNIPDTSCGSPENPCLA